LLLFGLGLFMITARMPLCSFSRILVERESGIGAVARNEIQK